MSERLLRRHEKAVREAESVSFADSLISRLNQIDMRLRQLEETRRLPESYFDADLKGRSKRLPSFSDDAHPKAALMDRLNVLENRIRQLNQELHNGGGGGNGGGDGGGDGVGGVDGGAGGDGDDTTGIPSPAEKQNLLPPSGNFGCYNRRKKPAKTVASMQDVIIEALKKREAALRRAEKKRMGNIRLYRWWVQAGWC